MPFLAASLANCFNACTTPGVDGQGAKKLKMKYCVAFL